MQWCGGLSEWCINNVVQCLYQHAAQENANAIVARWELLPGAELQSHAMNDTPRCWNMIHFPTLTPPLQHTITTTT